MFVKTLDARNPPLDTERTADLCALYLGGDCFDERATRFLPRRQFEHADLYAERIKNAHYLNYAGPIVDFYPAALFTGRLEMRPRGDDSGSGDGKPKPAPQWHSAWKEDCDGLGTDLVDFLRDRLTWALVKGCSWVLVDFPPAKGAVDSRAEWVAQGLDKPFLVPIEREDVISYKCDRRGRLLWAIVKWIGDARENPGDADEWCVEQWTIWTRTEWERWEYRWKRKDGRGDIEKIEATKIGGAPHPMPGEVPLVKIEPQHALWVMNRIASAQGEQLRARNALSWGLQRSCFAMRVFKLNGYDPKIPETGPIQGPGYAMVIDPDESAEWDAPPSEAFTPTADYADNLKDEIYRVTHQMALGVKNNAAATGRSAESKDADNAATFTVLRALAPCVREPAEKILDLVSLGKGEKDSWHVTGLDSFSVGDVGALVDTAIKTSTLTINSPKWHVLQQQRVALATVPDASQGERDQIVDEIEKNTPSEIAVPDKLGEPMPFDKQMAEAKVAGGPPGDEKAPPDKAA